MRDVRKQDGFTPEEIKAANRRFYDLAFRVYEEADGRRGEGLGRYLDRRLRVVRDQAGEGPLLDLGCGTGFLASRARRLFPRVVGVDLSPLILTEARKHNPQIAFLAADSDSLPFRDNTFRAVAAVALLHHLPGHRRFFAEARRVLKPDGILYTDHDLERRFRNLFYLPLRLYRVFRDEEQRYRRACPELTSRLYRATEIHREGLNPEILRREMEEAGFVEIEVRTHWLGLSPVFDRIGRLLNPDGKAPRGFAPSISITAKKGC
jgi:ubiquinone/menaquinone biosynthesis C-methylase UbiE